MTAVVAHGLTRRYGRTTALHDVSFDVQPSELFGFIGPDGAGKTTLFRILATLILPDAGDARVLGHDVVQELWQIRARVGYMPGRFSLYPDLTVRENLDFFAAVFGTTVDEGYTLIAPIYAQIERFANRRAGALSGGMKQKLALSCALVHRPGILLLDEPTTGVDAVSRREFWELLAQLKAQGLTIVVSTPYMDEASRCDRVALLQGGRILRIDRPGDIGSSFGRPLLGVRAPGDRSSLLRTLRAAPHALSVHPFGAELHYADSRTGADPLTLAAGLRQHLADSGFAGAEVAPIDPGIEDVFMSLMGGDGERPA